MHGMVSSKEWLPAVDALAGAAAQGDGLAMLAAIDSLAYASLTHTLCTINRYDAEAMRVVRLYSSNPAAYPPGGSKDKRGTDWGRHVLQEQRVFVGEGADAIRQAFDDHAAIAALGLRSIINVPVVLRQTCLGTVNFLMRGEQVLPGQVGAARLAALQAATAFGLLGLQPARPA